MIDITSDSGSSSAFLTKLSVRRDGTSSNNLVFDVDLCFLVADLTAAECIDLAIPGALQMYERALTGEEGKTSVRVSPSSESMFCTMSLSDLGHCVFDGQCAVQTIVYAVTPQAVSATFRIRFLGVEEKDAGLVCGALGKSVLFDFTKSQQGFAFAPKPETTPVVEDILDLSHIKKDTEVIASCVLGNGEYAFGSVLRSTKSAYLLSDFGKEISVKPSDIISQITVRGIDGSLSGILDTYQTKVANMGGVPTWEHIIMALGDEVVAGASKSDDDVSVGLSWATVTEAVKYSKSAL